MANIYRNRIERVKQTLGGGKKSAALLISSPVETLRTRDQYHAFRADNDLYYLSGIKRKNSVLLISTKDKAPLLFVRATTAKEKLWDGVADDIASEARALGAKVIWYKDLKQEVLTALKGIEVLYFQNNPGTLSQNISRSIFDLPAHTRGPLPYAFVHSDTLLGRMRLIKDDEEVALIRRAAALTAAGLVSTLELVRPGASEHQIGTTLDFCFRLHGGQPAFTSIIASGPAAAALHYNALKRTLKTGELLLIDCGAELDMYASDITRVFPVNGLFSPIQKSVYTIVLRAQKAAISACRPGKKYSSVHEAAAREITEGLKELKLLKGSTASLLKKQAYLPWFPHRIGHSLGLDVHDLDYPHLAGDLLLEPGMVLTIEPGIYFAKGKGKIPPLGIRIEDDVLVTGGKPEVLSEDCPKEIAEVEELMRG